MLCNYIPNDRRLAMARQRPFPDRQQGSALFADIGGFTALAEALEQSLGAQRGAEALTAAVDRIFDALIDAVDRHGGSVVAFAGDAMTCWFDADDGRAAIASALAMQAAMGQAGQVAAPTMAPRALGIKVSVANGQARRLLAGDPAVQCLDVLAGPLIDRLALADGLCRSGEVLVDMPVVQALGDLLLTGDEAPRQGFVLVSALRAAPAVAAAPLVNDQDFAPGALRAWVLGPVYDSLQAGQRRFLAEFRSVAALFGSFDGMTYDADDAGPRLDTAMREWIAIVTRHGGYLFDVTVGDKGSYFLVVFGAPHAHGDDVRRAIAAAVDLRRAGVPRIGVNAGRAYAGLYAGATRAVYRVAGNAVNLAARLMTAAKPGQVLLGGAVGESLDRRFAIRALDALRVKGVSGPVAVCELLGPAQASSHLSEPRYLLPLVGRSAEIGFIAQALAQARAGQGQVLAFCADAGMGKSRLINETLHLASDAGFVALAGECQPHGAGIAYLPWRSIWNAFFGLAPQDPAETRRTQLAVALGPVAHFAPLLASLLDLAMADNDVTRGMPAPVRKQVLEQVLTGALRGRAATGPLCIVVEDLHWADVLSRELLSTLAPAISDLPVLLVLAYRPADEPLALPPRREIALTEFTADEAANLASQLANLLAPGSATPEMVAAVTERANGNPFYIEELVRFVVERGGLTSALPATLESLILGRIDSLSILQQRTVKLASVIGRRFPVAWLDGAFADANNPGHSAIGQVEDLEHIRRVGLVVSDTPTPDRAFLFRHAVVRDVAYEMLGFALRQSLHEQLAAYLERSSGDESRPIDLLAYHYARSANTAKEAEYRRLAAELAIKNGAYAEALAQVQRASDIVSAQPPGPEHMGQELELKLLHGAILLVLDGQGSQKAKAVYDQARELSRRVPRGPLVGRAIFGLWTYYLFQGLMRPTEELAEEALALAMLAPDPGVRTMAHLALAQTHMWTGRWRICHQHYEHVLGLYHASQHQAHITQYAQNPRFTAANSGFWALWAMGRLAQARVVADLAVEDAVPLNHALTSVIAYLCTPVLAYLNREHARVAETVAEFEARSMRAGNPFYIAFALAFKGFSQVLAGRHQAGLDLLAAQDQTMRALGAKLIEPLVTSLLAESYLLADRLDDGLALLDQRCATFADEGRLAWMPDHLRLRAEIRLRQDPTCHDEAMALLRQAMLIAREHDAASFELRAALKLVGLLHAQARTDAASQVLEDSLALFGDGCDAADQTAARSLLAHWRP